MLSVTDSIINDTIFICEGDTATIFVFDSISDPNHQIIDNPVLGSNWDNTFWTVSPPIPYVCDSFPHIHLFPTVSGYYTLTFAFGIGNSCGGYAYTETDSIYIDVSPVTDLNISIIGNTSFCPGDTTLLIATGASSYNWYSPSSIAGTTSDSLFVYAPAYYWVAGFDTNAYGCPSADTTAINLHYWNSPPIYMNPSYGVICPNAYVTLSTITGCLNYDWYGPTGLLSTHTYSIQVNNAGYYFCIVTMPDGCVITSSTVEVKQYVTPFLVATPNDEICFGDTAMINLITNAGSNYQWQYPLSGNSLQQIIYNPGTYVCQVVSCGITTIASVDIIVSTPVAAITPSGPTMFCTGDSVILYANSGMENYLWLPSGSVADSIVVYNTGDYTLTTTDDINCHASSNIHIDVFNVYTPVVIDDTICEGQTATISATGAENYNWVFDSLSTSPFETDSIWNTGILYTTTTYYVYSTTPACTSSYIPVNVIVFNPVADITALGPTQFCEGDSLVLQANEGMDIYEWTPGGIGSDSLIVYNTGYYSLTTTDIMGCQATSNSIFIEMFSIYTPIVNDDTICNGQTAFVSATGGNNYNWVTDSISTTPFETNSAWFTGELYNTTTYYVYSTNPGCNSEHVPVTITVLDSLDAINPIIYSNSPVCDIDSIVLSSDADPLCDFYWTGPLGFASNTPFPVITNVTDQNSGIYSLYVNLNGCFSYQSSIPIIVYSTPELTVSNDTLICITDYVELHAYASDVTYEWSPPIYLDDNLIANPISTPDSSIYYTVTITDNNNCTNSADVNIIVQSTPILNYSLDTTIIVGESVEIFVNSDQTNLSYIWAPDYEISCLTCPDPIITPLETTEYYLEFSDTLNCSYPYVYILVTVLDEFSLDLPMAFTPNGDGNNDIVFVRGWGIRRLLEFRIFNRWGQEIFYTDDINQGWDGTYNGKPQNIDSYAYTVKVEFYNKRIADKKGVISLLR